MIRTISRSLSARLLGIFVVTSIVYVIASDYAVQLVLDRDYLRQILGAHVAMHTNYVTQDLGSPPSVERAREIAASNPMDIRITGPDIDWASNAEFPELDEIPFEPSRFFNRVIESGVGAYRWPETLEQLDFARVHGHSFVRISQNGYQVVFVTPRIGAPGTVAAGVAAPIVIGIVAILVLAGCYVAVRWLVRPVNWIKEGAERIGQGDLDYRIPATRKDDLGSLTQDINRMADDVQEMLEAKRQLLLAISHELRSPLTRAKVALEFLDDQALKDGLLEDIEEMERLIDDLLEGERLNTRHTKLQKSPTDVVELIESLVEADFSHEHGRIAFRAGAAEIREEVDATRVRLLVKNLLDNALCYTPDDAPPIEVSVDRGDGDVVIRVSDHGPGMSAAEAERATEPFYRADPARCRGTGGFGLGLYLCRRIAEAHGGSLKITSAPGGGTEVRVTLPSAATVPAAA